MEGATATIEGRRQIIRLVDIFQSSPRTVPSLMSMVMAKYRTRDCVSMPSRTESEKQSEVKARNFPGDVMDIIVFSREIQPVASLAWVDAG